MTLLGYLGSILLALCGLPQAIRSMKTKKADDISWLFLLMWLFGEILTLIYILPRLDYPLILNYSLNIVIVIIIMKYKGMK